MAKQFISDLKVGDKIDSYFSVKYKRPIEMYTKGFRFRAGLADKTGEVELNYWGDKNKESIQNIYKNFDEGDVISVRGIVGEFRDNLKIDVNLESGYLKKLESNEYDIETLLGKTNQDTNSMLNYIFDIIKSMQNQYLKKLLQSFFEDKEFVEEFKKIPASMYMHHACVGGLLEHTWGVVQICEIIAKIHPSLDKDLMYAGAILHDVGKISEFHVSTHIKVTERGMLRSHISIGEEMLLEKIKLIDNFPAQLKSKLLHIMISHHGEKEYGAVKEPQFPEAATVYLADYLDSRITQYIRIKKDAKTEDFRTYSKYLGEIYLK